MQKPENKPFFARFLEGQYPEVQTDIQAGKGGIWSTNKYPSDADEDVTMKYPSDGDDDGPTS
ncbi:microviridin/marinostatin family tricyclic proteinase inhibitor [Engelhardtia mirabilis]|uniref:Serine endopeptidase inhibitor n=1 Tax=Engelhardtia mirabilis TaxID=2528011 RepID=A0A518BHQ7_9BACT|nr:Serine endopeptidase inhibitor [Planctomycetes bacterium Pla133]QDV00799.1 Serine endopeptidase inhibitor [Planctomycetes bacterium Pla86]